MTEIFPGVGESWPTAQPISGSGPITPTSTQRLDAPSCFAATGNIHWYAYTLTNNAISLATNAAGVVGIYDAHGQEKACVTDASTASIGLVGAPGETLYIAVGSPTPIGSLSILDVAYTGVKGIVTDMLIDFPSSPTSENGMAVDATTIYMGDNTSVFAIPKQIGATAVEHGTGDGITTAHLGYDLVAIGGVLFSVDSTTSTTASRLFRISDGTTWGPTAWDLNPVYTSNPSHAIATDGNSLFLTVRDTATPYVSNFYSFAKAAAGAPALLGTNASVYYIVGLAADDQYFYVASNGPSGEGVYRLSRSNIAGAPVKIASVDTGTLCNNIELDAFVAPKHLYVRSATGDVHAVIDPASASPVHIGAISTLGTSSDFAMTFDKADGVLYLFETETDSAGRIVRIE